MKLTTLALRPEMPHESITGLCLPVALAALQRIRAIAGTGEALSVPGHPSLEVRVHPQVVALLELLRAATPIEQPSLHGYKEGARVGEMLADYLNAVEEFLSAFCQEITTETSTAGPLTIERRNAIAYEALIALRMKEGIRVGNDTKREAGNFASNLPNVSPEEAKQFAKVFFTEFWLRAFGK
jgi:hypothetical protein